MSVKTNNTDLLYCECDSVVSRHFDWLGNNFVLYDWLSGFCQCCAMTMPWVSTCIQNLLYFKIHI
jgi:hypothetical protein